MSIKLTYYGHSTFGIETEDAKLIVDPFFAPNNPAATVKVDEVSEDDMLGMIIAGKCPPNAVPGPGALQTA